MLEKMRKFLGVGVAWLGATVISVLIASAAVAGIRDRVVETPVAIGPPTSTATTTVVEGTTSTVGPSTTSAQSSNTTSEMATTTPPPETTSTTVTAPAETTTTTTADPPATTTTTTAAPVTTTTDPVSYSTHDLIGGTVVLAFGNGEVSLVSATPRPGFSVDPEHTGPKEVEVKFESNDHKSKLEADIENGELRVDVDEEPHDGDDD